MRAATRCCVSLTRWNVGLWRVVGNARDTSHPFTTSYAQHHSLCVPSTSATTILNSNSDKPPPSEIVLRSVHDYVATKEWDLDKKIDHSFRLNSEKCEYYNHLLWPPNFKDEDGEPLPGSVYHYRENIKYSPRKMYMCCFMVRGLSVDEALKQLDHAYRKGAAILAEVIREAIDVAVKDHNIEYKTNMWVADVAPRPSIIIKGYRKHARMGRYGTVKYRYTNVFVRLVEGKPEPFAGQRFKPRSGWDKFEEHVDYLRDRRIKYTL